MPSQIAQPCGFGLRWGGLRPSPAARLHQSMGHVIAWRDERRKLEAELDRLRKEYAIFDIEVNL